MRLLIVGRSWWKRYPSSSSDGIEVFLDLVQRLVDLVDAIELEVAGETTTSTLSDAVKALIVSQEEVGGSR